MTGGRERPSSLAWGFRSLGEWRWILLLSAATVALALPAALALLPALHSVFARTLAGDHVLRHHPVFGSADALEFLEEKADAIRGARQAATGGALLGLLLQILFAGGFVETLAREEKAQTGAFFAGAFRNFWHNLKCFAIFLAAAAVVLGAWIGGGAAASEKLFAQAPPGAPGPRLVGLGIAVVAAGLFAVLSLLHDFARIARRFEPAIGAWRGFGRAWRTLSGAWLRALGLLLFWAVLGGALWLGIVGAEWLLPAVSAGAILLHTFLQATAVVVRSGVRVAAWGSYVALADRRAPRTEPARVEPSPALSPEPLAPFGDEPSISSDAIDDAPLL